MFNRIENPASAGNLLRPIRGWLILAIVLQVCASGLALTPLIGLADLARTLLEDAPGRAERAWRIIVLSAAGLGVSLALRGLVELMTHFADNALGLSLRRQLAARIARAPLGWFSDQTGGRIKQILQDDVAAIHHLVGHAYVDMAGAVTVPLVVYAYLFSVDWRLSLVTLLPLPLFALQYRRILAATGPEKMAAYGAALARVNHSVVEFAQGIATIKSFGQQGRARHAYGRAVDDFRSFFLAWSEPLIRSETLASLAIAPITLLLLVLTFGTWFAAEGWITGLDVLPFALLGLGISIPFGKLSAGVQSLQTARGAMARLADAMAIPQEQDPATGARPEGGAVRFEHVSFAFEDGREVLSDISLDLRPGTVTALVGRSGSGKTTLARLLLRFYAPASGRITLDGCDLSDIETQHLYCRVGFVFQDAQLLRMSVRDNIALGLPGASQAAIETAARTADIHERIMQLPRGYDSVYGEDARFSGGEAQRLSIARALLLDPPILVLDEATAHADPESESAIQAALSRLIGGANRPRTVLVIAHGLKSVMHADTIAVLSEGRLVETGSHADLLARHGHYAQLWRTQNTAQRESADT